MTPDFVHTPVLLTATIEALQPRSGGRYVDATLGAGGHAEKVLELSTPDGLLLGLDADPSALRAASDRLARFADRLTVAEAYFDSVREVARHTGFESVQGILFDLGVSSPQLDVPERGFSFQHDGPLDMRLGPSAGQTGADLVNRLPVEELQRIFQEYGEERFARRIALRVVRERERAPIETTGQLAVIVTAAKRAAHSERIHPATRVFQALRIAVNDELGRLRRALPQAVDLLAAGGRLAVISFHSLEDRIAKQFIAQEARGCICPPNLPACVCGRQPTLRPVTRRPLTAGPDEIAANPRARSAKLRVAERITIASHQSGE